MENIWRERSPLEIIVNMIKIRADELRRIGYDKTMPYCEQELLENIIRAFSFVIDPDSEFNTWEACSKVVEEQNKLCSRLNKPYSLPDNYAYILQDILLTISFVTTPVVLSFRNMFSHEKDYQQSLIALKRQLEDRV